MFKSIITGTGSYIPEIKVPNYTFHNSDFYNINGELIETNKNELIRNFESITEIQERRYVSNYHTASDLGFLASKRAIDNANIDPEDLDLIIFTHNWGDISSGKSTPDMLPSLASRLKNKLGVKNPYTICFDIVMGCPGWVEALKLANIYIQAGEAKKILVVAAETISRICDPHDRDSMLFGDGAGAAIIEAVETDEPVGFLSWLSRSDAAEELDYLKMGVSNHPELNGSNYYLKMNGRKVYEYAVNTMPGLIMKNIEKAGLQLSNINKILIHQSNCKMNKAIFKRICRISKLDLDENKLLPSIISKLGNSSVATVPILLDKIMKGELDGHNINIGDTIIFASVGAGMNANTIIYRHL